MVQLVIDECFIIKFEIFHIFVPASLCDLTIVCWSDDEG